MVNVIEQSSPYIKGQCDPFGLALMTVETSLVISYVNQEQVLLSPQAYLDHFLGAQLIDDFSLLYATNRVLFFCLSVADLRTLI